MKKLIFTFMVNLKPLFDKVLIKRTDAMEKTAGGIIIPDSAKEKPIEGEVVAVGDGAVTAEGKVLPMSLKVGDVVLFAKWGGSEVKLDGVEYIIMKESDILAKKVK